MPVVTSWMYCIVLYPAYTNRSQPNICCFATHGLFGHGSNITCLTVSSWSMLVHAGKQNAWLAKKIPKNIWCFWSKCQTLDISQPLMFAEYQTYTTRRVSTCSPALENAGPGPLDVAAWTATSPNLDIARGPQRFFLRRRLGDVPTLHWVWGKQKLPSGYVKIAIYSGFSYEKLWFSIVMLVYQRVHFPPPKGTCHFLSSSFMSEDLHGCAYITNCGPKFTPQKKKQKAQEDELTPRSP